MQVDLVQPPGESGPARNGSGSGTDNGASPAATVDTTNKSSSSGIQPNPAGAAGGSPLQGEKGMPPSVQARSNEPPSGSDFASILSSTTRTSPSNPPHPHPPLSSSLAASATNGDLSGAKHSANSHPGWTAGPATSPSSSSDPNSGAARAAATASGNGYHHHQHLHDSANPQAKSATGLSSASLYPSFAKSDSSSGIGGGNGSNNKNSAAEEEIPLWRRPFNSYLATGTIPYRIGSNMQDKNATALPPASTQHVPNNITGHKRPRSERPEQAESSSNSFFEELPSPRIMHPLASGSTTSSHLSNINSSSKPSDTHHDSQYFSAALGGSGATSGMSERSHSRDERSPSLPTTPMTPSERQGGNGAGAGGADPGAIDDGGDGDGSGEEKGGNGRLLKQTKRAAQNRAAQQAFRKRKENRMRELEQKEQVLQQYLDRERELIRREHEVREREQQLQHAKMVSNPSSSESSTRYSGNPSTGIGTSMGLSSGRSNDGSKLALENQLPPLRYPYSGAGPGGSGSGGGGVGDSSPSLPESSTMVYRQQLDAAFAELRDTRKAVQEKEALCDSLRRSLEDLGAENRSLRSMINKHGVRTDGLDL